MNVSLFKDTPCRQCNGEGKIPSKIAGEGWCPLCRGAGFELTKLGDEVKTLLFYHYRGRM